MIFDPPTNNPAELLDRVSWVSEGTSITIPARHVETGDGKMLGAYSQGAACEISLIRERLRALIAEGVTHKLDLWLYVVAGPEAYERAMATAMALGTLPRTGGKP